MKNFLLSFLLLIVLLPASNLSAQGAENVVLITFDGLRWQEVFGGIDENLATHKDYSPQTELLMQRFWHSNSNDRAQALLPFIHNTVFSQGIYAGNPHENSC